MVYYEAALRNTGFKYLVCWNSPMVEAVSYLQEYPPYKNQVAKFPTI